MWLRAPAAIPMSGDTCSDSIAKLFHACFRVSRRCACVNESATGVVMQLLGECQAHRERIAQYGVSQR